MVAGHPGRGMTSLGKRMKMSEETRVTAAHMPIAVPPSLPSEMKTAADTIKSVPRISVPRKTRTRVRASQIPVMSMYMAGAETYLFY